MSTRLTLTALLVHDYDEAIAFYVGKLGFTLTADDGQGGRRPPAGADRRPDRRPGRPVPADRRLRRRPRPHVGRRRPLRRAAAPRALRHGGGLRRPLRQPLG